MSLRTEIGLGTVVFLLAASSASAQAPPKVVRDWAKSPAVVQVDTTADIVAVGDVHGDRDRLVRLLTAAGIVDDSVRWSGGRNVVVFTGDLIDKGPKGPAVLALLMALRDQAQQAGGRVLVLMGNHEADFLRNPESEKAREFALQLKASGMDAKVVASCKGEMGALLCGLPFAARVNDWFFSHAGNSGGRSMPKLIADLESGVDRDGFDTVQLTDSNSLIQARLGVQGPGGRSWFDLGPRSQAGDQTLAAYAAALGVNHIVQGHQHNEEHFSDDKIRNIGEIYQWRGRLFLIDVGMSRDIDDSVGAALRIRARQADAICPDGRTATLWDAAKKPEGSKGVHCGKL
jgi:Calcineurin-like phosphoesterase